MKQKLSESLENYLEVILALEKTNKVARAKEIAEKLNLQQGSVTSALKNLAAKGYVNYKPYSFITLTDKGKKRAKDITYRHLAIKEFLLKVLRIDEQTAEETACRMEHAIDAETIDHLACFINFIFRCPRAGENWIQSFKSYCAAGNPGKNNCKQCIDELKTTAKG
ncbi:MAG: metal-dependent transcriptional regulator [Desulfobacteraceae bacterium]|nr:metal-dependent transcriptional regulator [Desulfobacteraceae bacterium]